MVAAISSTIRCLAPRRSRSSVSRILPRLFAPALLIAAVLCLPHAALAQGFTQYAGPIVGSGAIGNAVQGNSLAVSGEGTVVWGGPLDNSNLGAVWVASHNNPIVKLVGAGNVGSSLQGQSVAISADGNTILVGAQADNSSAGAAWVFTRSGGVWSQQGSKLVGTNVVGNALRGYSVALSADGNTAVVGGPYDNSNAGAAWVFTRSNGVWTQQGDKLVGTGGSAARQGWSVALSSDGSTALVGGAYDNSGFGAVWAFTRSSNGLWSQQGGKFFGAGTNGNAHQGTSIALSADGNTALVGGPTDNGGIGALWVFTRNTGGVWSPQGSKLVGSNSNAGGSPANVGQSVSLSADGNTAIAGGPYFGGTTGATWAFTRSAGTWTELNKFTGTGGSNDANANQGYSVALSPDGAFAAVGGPSENSNVGAIWVFVRRPVIATATHDFNGDGKSDIAWRQTGGTAAAWLMNGAAIAQSASFGVIPTSWQIVGQRDFNNDGKYDLLWRDTSAGTVALWLMSGTSIAQTGTIGTVATSWSIVGTSDFNYDGYADILWRDSSGALAVWLMNGTSIAETGTLGTVPLNWTIAAVDARRNIFWRDTSSGTVAIWQLYGTQVQQTASLGSVPLNWTIVGVGDFDGNGSNDIVWRDTSSGTVAIWLLNGLALKQTWSLGAVANSWAIVQIGDYNGNGGADILWRDTNSGQAAIWYINSTTGALSSSAGIGTIGTDWSVQNTNAN